MLRNKFLIEKFIFLVLILFSISVFTYASTNKPYQFSNCEGDVCKIPANMLKDYSSKNKRLMMQSEKNTNVFMPAEKQRRIRPLSSSEIKQAMEFYQGLRKCKDGPYKFPNPVANTKPDVFTNVIHGYEINKCFVTWESFGGHLSCKFSPKTLKLLTSKKALKELRAEMASGKYKNAADTQLAKSMKKECIFVPIR